jgi:hypothetical protein
MPAAEHCFLEELDAAVRPSRSEPCALHMPAVGGLTPLGQLADEFVAGRLDVRDSEPTRGRARRGSGESRAERDRSGGFMQANPSRQLHWRLVSGSLPGGTSASGS